MPARKTSSVALLQWVIVLVVGIVVVALVLGLNLITRLSDGQKVINAAKPAFTTQSLNTDVAGINILSDDVQLADPIVTPAGGGAAEVPTIVGFVAAADHISDAQALAALQKGFPHTAALLQSIPLSAVTAEVPHLEAFLETALKVTPAQLVAALQANFPAILQTITYLPDVTNNWYNIPGLAAVGFTDFNGTPVRSVPQLRTYFKDDLIPAVAAQKKNFDSLTKTTVNWIPWVILIIGIVVIVFSLLMILRNLRGIGRIEAIASASVVVVVGLVVIVFVLALGLIPRLSATQRLIKGLNPAFTVSRVKGDRIGINEVSDIINFENPVMTPSGGAAAEVPKLIAFVSSKTGLAPTAVVGALQKNFPHTLAVLEAIPLTSVSAELPSVVGALTPAAVPKIPRLAQTVLFAPPVTNGWNDVPGTAGATNFEGGPVNTVPEIGTYFSHDVIPVLEKQRRDWVTLTATSRVAFLGPLVLIIGIIAFVYGLLMVALAKTRAP